MTARNDDPRLSVIIPIAADEREWRGLLDQLAALPTSDEVIVVGAGSTSCTAPAHWPSALALRGCVSAAGRARQMNVGAQAARGRWLWFLHADSRLTLKTLSRLSDFLANDTQGLGYFDLAFRADGPRLASLNAFGANLRARWLGLPFGDQGFVLPKDVFTSLHGFDEALRYGEDHMLVWAARGAGIPLIRIGAPLLTSARKYAARGWIPTTLRHWVLTLRQAVPAWWRARRT